MPGDFLDHAAQCPAFEAGFAMTAQHDQIDVLSLDNAQKRGRNRAEDHNGVYFDAHELVRRCFLGKVRQSVSLFLFLNILKIPGGQQGRDVHFADGINHTGKE